MKKNKNPIINLLKYAWHYSPRKSLFVLFVVFCVIANTIGLFDVILIGRVFNSVQFDSSDPNLLSYIIKNLGLLVLVTFSFWVFHGTSRVIETKNAFLVRKNYKNEMFDRVMDLPVKWQKDNHSGDTISRINKASEALFTFSEEIFVVVQNIVQLIGSIIILSFFDWKMAIVAVVASVAAVYTSIRFDRVLEKGYEEVYKAENFLASGIHDYISNIITVISLRLKKKVSNEIGRRSMRAFGIFKRNTVINEIKWFSISLYLSVAISGVLIYNAYSSYKANGVIIIGTLFVLYSYMKNIGNFFFNFAWMYNTMVQRNTAVVLAESIRDEYEKKVINDNKNHLPENWHVLKIKDLRFSYKKKGDEDYAGENIDDVSICLERNAKIALIGESGSGKSTILSLIRGLHGADRARVYCDGKKMPHGLSHLYEHSALVPQDPELFNASVSENITMGIRTKMSEIEDVLGYSRFDVVAERLKNGLKTNVLEKGVSLSGGEKQRLALARGLLMAKKYDFLLLDEPTSSVDSENELNIYKNIFEYYKNNTIISAIHRLHLLQYFDYIYFFEKGKIIAEGNFNTLLNDEKFKTLWNNYSKNQSEIDV